MADEGEEQFAKRLAQSPPNPCQRKKSMMRSWRKGREICDNSGLCLAWLELYKILTLNVYTQAWYLRHSVS
jgi:hypothetical protein